MSDAWQNESAFNVDTVQSELGPDATPRIGSRQKVNQNVDASMA